MDSNSATDPRIVFVVSQPRAGSTLLQTMLDGHPSVFAPGEAWLMLPLVHAVSGSFRNVQSPYDTCLADDAISVFAQEHLEGGLSDVQREIGHAAQRIYQAACVRAKADVIIDKTPRYYWIIEELLRMVPQCRVILLIRNPLAVMSSIIETWTRPRSVGFLSGFRGDLLEAPSRLANASTLTDPRIMTVCYEDLVSTPDPVLHDVQRFIGIEVKEGLAHYGDAARRAFGDPRGIHRDTAANQKSIDKWVEKAAHSAARWRLLNDYREYLGEQLIGRLGYDFQHLADVLDDVQPPGTSIAPSLSRQLKPRPHEPLQSMARMRRVCADVASKLGRSAA